MHNSIKVADCCGFCFGVKRAVELAEQEALRCGRIYTYGELIHNPQEIERLRARGIIPLEKIEGNHPEKIIIRAHGIGREEEEILRQNFSDVVDLTCPFVKKIHNIAEKYCQEGYKIVIIGNRLHPEVRGICGWCCGNSAVIGDETEAEAYDEKICVVAQTTIKQDVFDRTVIRLQELNSEVVVCNTICSATAKRQQAAAELAKQVDEMIVIGGKKSSNTRKLYEVCSVYCSNTRMIESAEELEKSCGCSGTVGITAGASTPGHIIKEVIHTMEENMKNGAEQGNEFAQLFEESLKTLNTGETVRGTVMEIRPTEVLVDLGFKSDGIIPLSELSDDPTADPADLVKVGDEIEVFVIRVNDVEGQVLLSKKKVEQKKNWEKIVAAQENNEILTGRVVEVMEKGVSVYANGMRIFIPASQASERYMADLSELKGQEFPFRIIDINERRHRVVGSIKSVLKEESQKKQDAFWAEAAVGKEYHGVVKSITDFGAFVDIGGVDGLLHVSEMSWKKIHHPSEVVKVGDEIDVFIKALDEENHKISLGHRKDEDNPWLHFESNHKVGDIVNGTVVRLVPFGAFVDVDGVDGLIHISELSWRRINHPSEILSEGQVVECNIKDIDVEKQKLSLGYKRVEDNPWEIFKSKYHVGDVVKCKVVRMVSFGAFAEILEGVDGLIHISQIADRRIGNVAEVLSVGQEVDAKIIDIKEDTGKVSLSIRALLEDGENAAVEVPEEAEEAVAEAEETPVEAVEESVAEEAPVAEEVAETEAVAEEAAVAEVAVEEPVEEEAAKPEDPAEETAAEDGEEA